MGQRSLFGAGRQRLVDDHTGTIEYRPGWVAEPLAAAWFEALRPGIAWQSRRRTMYQRELEVPRLLAAFDLDERLPAPLDAIVARVRAEFPTPFTDVGLNLYRDGRDSVAPHHDGIAGQGAGTGHPGS